MNRLNILCVALLKEKVLLSEQIRKIHLFGNLRRQNPSYLENPNVESSLWFTSLPARKKRALSILDKKKAKMKTGPVPNGPLVVECKHEELNHYRGTHYNKFDVVPLASRAWKHRKSTGDYFSILPISEHPAFLMSPSETLPDTFEELGVCNEIIKLLSDMEIGYPTTIQAKAIESLLKGNNVLMAAETGCGKTLAYLIPLLQNILNLKRIIPNPCNSPYGVILLPTRELALQVGMVAQKLCPGLGINCLTFLGGKARHLVSTIIVEQVDLIVASIGVLCKLQTHQVFSMNLCKHLVVDEADTLLDDSFSHMLTKFIKKSKLYFIMGEGNERINTAQLCLSSATMPRDVDSILNGVITLDGLDKISTKYLHKIQPHILQKFLRVSKLKKPEILLRIVKRNKKNRVPTMIFSNSTKTCNWINIFLNENGVKSVRVNTSLMAEERLSQYRDFKSGLVDVISCTDVASRGLDCTRVKHVINYEFPRYMADYVHRCGRTGRIGHDQDCLITNLISGKWEVDLVQEIEKAARTESTLKYVNNNIARLRTIASN